MNTQPLVSMVVCTYNSGPLLLQAVESCLRQSYEHLEVVVVDDGSTDGSVDSLRGIEDKRLRIIRQENRGKPSALNRALSEISGEFYAVQDADDLSHPRRIESQLRVLQDEPELAAVFCGHDLIIHDRHTAPRFRAKDPEACRTDIDHFRMPAHDPTGMYRWEAVADMRYDEDLPIVEGYDYILRVGERKPLAVLGECLYSYRIHGDSVTRRDPRRRDQMVAEMLRRACLRRGIEFEVAFPEAGRSYSGHRGLDNNLATNFIESVVDLRNSGRWIEAIETGLACARLHPLDPAYCKALLYAVMPAKLRTRIRRSEREETLSGRSPR